MQDNLGSVDYIIGHAFQHGNIAVNTFTDDPWGRLESVSYIHDNAPTHGCRAVQLFWSSNKSF